MKNVKYEILIVIFFILVRLPGLGHDNFNTDVWKWKVRSYDFSTAIFTFQPEMTLQKYHPGVTLMWIGTTAIKFANIIADYNGKLDELQKIFLLDRIQKYFLVLVLAITTGFIFFVLKKLFNKRIASFAILLLTLEPFYVALTRVFHLEGLLSTFMLCSALWLYYFLQDKSKSKRLYISAFFAGLALLTKTSAVYLFLFVGLMSVTQALRTKKYKDEALWFIKWLITTILMSFIFWPALWVVPAQVFQELTRGVVDIGVDTEHVQFYFGKLVSDPGYFYFLVVLALRSSIYLFAGLLGLLFTFKKLDKLQRNFIFFLLIYSFFYFLQISIPSKKLDRYILPGLVSLSLCSSFFWLWLIEKINIKIKYAIFFIPIVVTLFILHPDYFSYYNPIFGGLKTGINVLEPKWLIGEREILNYFKDKQYEPSGLDESFEEVIYSGQKKNVLSVGFQEKYYTQIWPFFREINAWAVIQDLTPFAVKTKYFVYPVWDDRYEKETRFSLKYLDDIKIRGVSAYRVYERIL